VNCFDFGGNPDHDADTGILKRNFYHFAVTRAMTGCTEGGFSSCGGDLRPPIASFVVY